MQQPKNIWNNENLIQVLKKSGVAIMPTDTIYGMVGLAQNEAAVNRIYKIRKRNPKKPCIIIIGDIDELKKFSIILSAEQKDAIEKYWFPLSEVERSKILSSVEGPSPISIVLDCLDEKLSYLHRGTNTLAFRVPVPQALRDLLLKVGPLIAPSANAETFPPNETITEAKKYFGDLVDLYIDGGELKGKASKLIKLHSDGTVTILRK